MVSLSQAAHTIAALSRQVTQQPSPEVTRQAANFIGSVGQAIQDLDYRMEAVELILSTLARKAGLTESQVYRQQPPEGSGPQKHRYEGISKHLQRILAVADS